jgi:hypothetical protein
MVGEHGPSVRSRDANPLQSMVQIDLAAVLLPPPGIPVLLPPAGQAPSVHHPREPQLLQHVSCTVDLRWADPQIGVVIEGHVTPIPIRQRSSLEQHAIDSSHPESPCHFGCDGIDPDVRRCGAEATRVFGTPVSFTW